MMDILLFNKINKLNEEIIKTEKQLLKKGWQRARIINSYRGENEYYEYVITDTLNTDMTVYESQKFPFKRQGDEIWFRYKNYEKNIVQTYIIS